MSVDTGQAVLDRALEGRVNAADREYSEEFKEKYSGIWTHGSQYKDEDDYFLGLNARKFHDTTRRYVIEPAGNAINAIFEATIGRAWSATKGFAERRWYMQAVPLALALGIGMYSLLRVVEPAAPAAVQAENVKKRKKGPLEYWMKYFNQGKKSLKELSGSDEPQTK